MRRARRFAAGGRRLADWEHALVFGGTGVKMGKRKNDGRVRRSHGSGGKTYHVFSPLRTF
jgi:hypothetical protein